MPVAAILARWQSRVYRALFEPRYDLRKNSGSIQHKTSALGCTTSVEMYERQNAQVSPLFSHFNPKPGF